MDFWHLFSFRQIAMGIAGNYSVDAKTKRSCYQHFFDLFYFHQHVPELCRRTLVIMDGGFSPRADSGTLFWHAKHGDGHCYDDDQYWRRTVARSLQDEEFIGFGILNCIDHRSAVRNNSVLFFDQTT